MYDRDWYLRDLDKKSQLRGDKYRIRMSRDIGKSKSVKSSIIKKIFDKINNIIYRNK